MYKSISGSKTKRVLNHKDEKQTLCLDIRDIVPEIGVELRPYLNFAVDNKVLCECYH